MMKVVVLLGTLILASALFENTEVQRVDGQSFDDQVTESDGLWLVFFHAAVKDQDLVSTVENTALALRNMVQVAAVDSEEVTSRFNADLPSFYLFGFNKEIPVKFEGEHTAEHLVNFVFDQARNYTFDRIGAKPKKKKVAEATEEIEEEDVIVLEDENFDDTVMNSQDAWFVEFYAPWCDHCKKLSPEWAKLGTLLKGEIKVAKIDSSKHTKSHEKYKVKGYPSLKFFPAGEKLQGEWEDYDGSREAASMASWAREAKRRLRPLYFEQLTTQTQFKQNCLDYNGICVILFVPHLYDTGAEGREKYLQTFKDVIQYFKNKAVLPHKQKPFNYFWSQGADQYDFEERFGLGGAGYPSVLAISPKKKVWSKMRGSFNKEAVDRFIQNLIRGKEHVGPIRFALEIKNVKAWDGQELAQ